MAKSLNKLRRVRVALWTKRLCQASHNALWKSTRKSYAQLLLDMLEAGNLDSPFDRLPPKGNLPQIPSPSVKRPTSFKPYSPRGQGSSQTPQTTKSLTSLRKTRTPSILTSPREAPAELSLEQMKFQNLAIREELKEAKLLTLTAKAQLAVRSSQRRDAIVSLQQDYICQLKNELLQRGLGRGADENHSESFGGSESYLSFRNEIADFAKGKFIAETRSYLQTPRQTLPPSAQLSPVRTSFDFSEHQTTIA
jgi:hypothetical protein